MSIATMIEKILNISTKYISEDLDKNRTSTAGWFIETQADVCNDSEILAEYRAKDSVIELSTNRTKLIEVAKRRNIDVARAKPASATFSLILKLSDILKYPTTVSNTYSVTIDRRSYFEINNLKFSLNDDIKIVVQYISGKYTTMVSYVGGNEDNLLLTSAKYVLDDGSDGIIIYLRAFQYSYNEMIKTVTNQLDFLYDGIPFDFDGKIADFDIYYRTNLTSDFTKIDKYYKNTVESSSCLYYKDSKSDALYIYGNKNLTIPNNSEIKVVIKETTGADGNFNINDYESVFIFYNDGVTDLAISNYSIMFSDSSGGSDEPSITEIQQMLNSNRFGFTSINEAYIKNYLGEFKDYTIKINKRNDLKIRMSNLYTMLKNTTGEPIKTKTDKIGILLSEFDLYYEVSGRKILKANNLFTYNAEREAYYKVDPDLVDIPALRDNNDNLALGLPFMIILNNENIASYHLNTINDDILLDYQFSSDYKYQLFTQKLNIYRTAFVSENDNKYVMSLDVSINTTEDLGIVDVDGNVLDDTKFLAYMRIFDAPGVCTAYLEMKIVSYNVDLKTYRFEGSFITSDYITEENKLEITSGLKSGVSGAAFNDVLIYEDMDIDIVFAYNEIPTTRTHSAYSDIPELINMTLTNGYVNNGEIYLIKNISKIMQSYVSLEEFGEDYIFYLKEVPFIEYTFLNLNIKIIYDTLNKLITYLNYIKDNTDDFSINFKFISTYGKSQNIYVNDVPLNNLTPTLKFRLYGDLKILSSPEVISYIKNYFYNFSAETKNCFISNLSASLEKDIAGLVSCEYLGIDDFNSSYQKITNYLPDYTTMTKTELVEYIPESANISQIILELREV